MREWSPVRLAPFAFCAIAQLFSHSAMGGEDAHVLPAGVGRINAVFAQSTGITQTFDSGGHAESLTAPYNLPLDADNLKNFNPDFKELVDGLNKLMPGIHYNASQRNNGHYGLTEDPNDPTPGDAISRGFLSVDAEGKHQEMQFGVMYGVTDRLTLGFMVPIIKNTVVVNHALLGNNTADDIYNYLKAQNSGFTGTPEYQKIVDALNVLRTADDETLQGILQSRGYSRFASYDGSGMGDIVAGARYNYWNKNEGQWLSSFQLGVTMPTGKLRPPSELTQLDFGQGAWDVSIANILNWSPTSFITLTNGWHWTHRFWNHRLMRVRKDPSDFIPDTSGDEVVNQYLGDKYWVSIGGSWKPTGALSISTNYEWYWKTHEQYEGAKTDRDYNYMADNTFRYLQTWSVGASLTSIPSFMRHEFFLPAEISFDAYVPVRGMNTPIAPYGVLQLALYF